MTQTPDETPFVTAEIATQPELWRQVGSSFAQYGDALPSASQRVAAVGCGTSWFMAMAYAALREDLGQGETDAFAGSEFPKDRAYDVIVVISRYDDRGARPDPVDRRTDRGDHRDARLADRRARRPDDHARLRR